MEKKASKIIESVNTAFYGIELENGVSWSEAGVLDNYGSIEERKKARNQDEINDWTKIPHNLIGDLKYQDVLPFIDAKGMRFYLPAVMIFTLKNYKNSQSLIIHSIIYKLTDKKTAIELQEILNAEQKSCVIQFLQFCLEIGDDYFDIFKLEERLDKYWINYNG